MACRYGVGEYKFWSDPDNGEAVNVLQEKPRANYHVSFNTGVAFRSGSDTVAVQFLDPTKQWKPMLFLNGKVCQTFVLEPTLVAYSSCRVSLCLEVATKWAS